MDAEGAPANDCLLVALAAEALVVDEPINLLKLGLQELGLIQVVIHATLFRLNYEHHGEHRGYSFGWWRVGLAKRRLAVAIVQKGLRLAVKRVAVFFEVHEMGGASDLHIAFHGRRLQRIKKPVSIGVGSEAVPFAADDRDRCADETWIVGEIARAGISNVLPRAAR